eukprot:TRINITY_DN3740_c0_g1_i12.p1 TRINITY_DN3740_c0_g1~~TRINITY_DN3740_c0_g1_i12.p1  ORF type:complete len:452 (+),score=89.84 TRINITY_DN3740_c0_g1_i12:40-1395(+)
MIAAASSTLYEENDQPVFEGVLYVKDEKKDDFNTYPHIIQSDFLNGYTDHKKTTLVHSLKIRFATLEVIKNCGTKRFPCGFTIKTELKKFMFYCTSPAHLNTWVERLRRYCFFTHWQMNYTKIRTIAKGKNSEIYVLEHKPTGAKYVGKFVAKELFVTHPTRLQLVKNEIAIMAMIRSDFIVTFVEAYQDEQYILIVMEYVMGGTLFERVNRKKRYTEGEAAVVLFQLLKALQMLHQNDVLHRDVKLENIFMVSDADDVHIKLGDFDLASLMRHINHNKQCGTPGYMAPEVFYKQFGGYSAKTDVFSAGIVLYAMLSGTFPFKARDLSELYEKNKAGEIAFQSKLMNNISPECRELIERMLCRNPADRVSIDEVINHQYIHRHCGSLRITYNKFILAPGEENFADEDMDEIPVDKILKKKGTPNMNNFSDTLSKMSGVSSNSRRLVPYFLN